MKPLQYSQRDHEAYMIFALYFVLVIASRCICKCILYTEKITEVLSGICDAGKITEVLSGYM